MRLILNPSADRGHAASLRKPLRTQIDQAAPEGTRVEWCVTTHPRHAIELAEQAGRDGADVVVAVGGDGTVHEVINGLMRLAPEERPLLGIIPVGSGNDFAANLGLPTNRSAAVQRLFAGEPRTVDACLIRDDTGRTEYWNNTAGIGFTGSVNYATRSLKQLRGFVLYLAAVFRAVLDNPDPLEAQIRMDEEPVREETIRMISVCNGPREGGGFPVAPGARLDDGLLTYTIMGNISRAGILRFLPVVLAGNHLRYTRVFEGGEAASIRVTVERAVDIHIDGEIFSTHTSTARVFELDVLPQAVRVIV
ncbi:MAG: diacylglycerol kinase family lipid kinase [Chloroflexi bacterium]|nr:diacylglycerol kinase family lipid kinase [Chloroflexota bacterium]